MAESDNSIMKSTGIMTMATLASRVTGLLRTWVMAFALGEAGIASAYAVANGVPNAIFDLVAGGVLGTAFLPVYLLQKEKTGRGGADRFASNVLNLSIIVLGVLAILATVFSPEVVFTQTFLQPVTGAVREQATWFFRFFAIQIVFYGIGGVVTGVLNANRIYGIPALAPALNNILVIASFLGYFLFSTSDPQLAMVVLAVGTTLGVVAQFAIQIPTLVRMGFKYALKIDLRDPALKEALRIALPTLIYIVGTIVSYSCRNAFAGGTGDNGQAILYYTWMWYQLPYGVIAVSLSTVFVTEMSDAVARGDFASLRGFVKSGLRSTLFLIIPLAGMMFALSVPIIQLFAVGRFDEGSVPYIASILAFWVVSLPLYAGQMYLYRVFAALRQFMTFALVSCGLCVVQIGLYALLCQPGVIGLYGIPVADFVYYGLQFVVMAAILRGRIGSFGMPNVLGMAAKVLVATLVGMAVAYAILLVVPFQAGAFAGFMRILVGLAQIALCGIVGLVVSFALCRLLRVPEMRLVGSILGRFARRPKRDEQITEPIILEQSRDSEKAAPQRRSAEAAGIQRERGEAGTRAAVPSGSSRKRTAEPAVAAGGRTRTAKPAASAAQAKQLPAPKHAKPGSWEAVSSAGDTGSWNKVGRHAAPSHRIDPGSTAAIKARAKHGH